MTNEELKEIKDRSHKALKSCIPVGGLNYLANSCFDVPKLIEEVRRLQLIIKAEICNTTQDRKRRDLIAVLTSDIPISPELKEHIERNFNALLGEYE